MKQITLTLTDEQLEQVLAAIEGKETVRRTLTEEQVEQIAAKLNERIDIPFMKERRESKILTNVVRKVDAFMVENLPDEIYELYADVADGLTDEEAEGLAERLSYLAVDYIDLPYLPEFVERKAINFVVGIIINGMRKNWNIDIANEKFKEMALPEENTDAPKAMVIK